MSIDDYVKHVRRSIFYIGLYALTSLGLTSCPFDDEPNKNTPAQVDGGYDIPQYDAGPSDTDVDTDTDGDTDADECEDGTPVVTGINFPELFGRVNEPFKVNVTATDVGDGEVTLDIYDEPDAGEPYPCTEADGGVYDCTFIPDTPGFYYGNISAQASKPCAEEVLSDKLVSDDDVTIKDRCVETVGISYEDTVTQGKIVVMPQYFMNGIVWETDVVGKLGQCNLPADDYDAIETCYHSTINDGEYHKSFISVGFVELAETEDQVEDLEHVVGYHVKVEGSGYFLSEKAYSVFEEEIDEGAPLSFWESFSISTEAFENITTTCNLTSSKF